MQPNITAFADEFGTNSFDFDSQGSHFIVATIICKSENLESLKQNIDIIRKKHNFQTGEIKSSKIGQDHNRRIRVLKDILELDFSIYALIVDKRLLYGQGFHIKKSFYKYINNLLYKELFRTFPSLDLIVDEHGSNDFMREFKKYIQKHHERTLFSGSEFNIQNSKLSYYIQLADLIAGTLGYIYDETKKSAISPQFEELLKPKISALNFFPKVFSFDEFQNSNVDANTFDPQIAKVCFLRVQDFIDKTTGNDQQKLDQINFLKLLLLYQRAYPRNRYILTSEIFNHLNQNRKDVLREEYFRTKVVGNLRDLGVLIASSRDGYKIPTCSKDLDNFINHGKRIVLPMLNRIKEARDTIMLATGNQLDILDKNAFIEIKEILDK